MWVLEQGRASQLPINAHTADIKANISLQILLTEQLFPKWPPEHLLEGPTLEIEIIKTRSLNGSQLERPSGNCGTYHVTHKNDSSFHTRFIWGEFKHPQIQPESQHFITQAFYFKSNVLWYREKHHMGNRSNILIKKPFFKLQVYWADPQDWDQACSRYLL